MPAPTSKRHTIATVVIIFFLMTAGASYTVESGDTVSGIASKHGVSAKTLIDINDISNPDRIYVGQELTIPGGGDSSEGESPSYHVVKAGESLSTIAAKYGLTASELAAANGITNTDVIYVGTKLTISGEATSFTPGSGSSGSHVVAAGETLGRIAARYGTTISALVDLNSLENPDLIQVGQTLVVPDGGWSCPVVGASFFNDYGFPRSGDRFHEGTDMFAPRGTPVVAPVSGRVEFTIGAIGGLQFKLFGDDGATYIGSHMDSFGASGNVTAGTVIGAVGDSGNAKGSNPHLHFEIHPDDGVAVNPYPYLSDSCR